MSEWQVTPLGDIIDIFDSIRVPLSAAQRATRKGPYPYYGAQGIIDYLDDYLFDGRYLLIPEDGENLNSRKLPIAYFADGKFWVNNHAHIVRGRSGIANDVFLKHALSATDISGYVTGAAQPKLNQANLKRIAINLPPLETQRRIAGILGAYDDLIEVNRRRVAVLEEMARSLFDEWFVRFRFPGHEDVPVIDTPNGPLPVGWDWIRLADVCSCIRAGSTPSRKERDFWVDGKWDWFTTGELKGSFLFSSKEKLSQAALDKKKARIFPRKTVFIALYGATIGSLGIADVPCSSNQAALGLVADGNRMKQWQLFHTLERLKGWFVSVGQGAAQQNISKEKVGGALVALPPSQISELFDFSVSPMWEMRRNLEQQIGLLTATRDLLLPRLISGQLSVERAERELEDAA